MAGETVSALDRGLALMQCFSDTRRVLGPTELSRLTGIPRPSVIRLASTLVAHRWLQPEPDGDRYMLGAGVVSLARAFLSGLDVRAVARPGMQALADRFGGSVYLALCDGPELVLVEACRARAAMLSMRLDVGSRIPLASSALGRAYLGTLPPDRREALIERLRQARGAEWASLEPGLREALAEHARHGWCVSAGSFHREINSVAVGLTGPQGEVMALNCGGPAFRFPVDHLRQDVAPALRELADEVAQRIGGDGLPAAALAA